MAMDSDTASDTATASDSHDGKQPAPWLPIPARAISAVEHPCIIKNVDKGIKSLGGPSQLSKALISKLQPVARAHDHHAHLPGVISASLRPDDPLAKRLLSTPVTTNNLLLKVTVPKRTGRKRKRGSSGPFLADDEIDPGVTDSSSTEQGAYRDPATILRSMQDNAGKYTVSLAGVIDETHRFRNLPDIQWTASRDPVMGNIRDNMFPLRYSQVKNYNLNTAPGANPALPIGPSAEWLQTPVAFNYRYQQNPFVKYSNSVTHDVNLQRSLAYAGYTIISMESDTVPQGPKPYLPPEHTLTPYLQSLIANIRAELRERPIITRHKLFNTLGWDKRDRLRSAAVYCGYFFATGPWREALIGWGCDPRLHPHYRQYQTISFISFGKTGTARHASQFDKHVRELVQMSPQELAAQHIFDGKTVSHTGNLYQFLDITDPLIRRILDTEDIRDTCAPTFQGWYHVGTWAKATVILKDKMNTILGGEQPDDSIYERVMAWPELWDDKEVYDSYRSEMYDKQLHKEKGREHNVMNNVRLAARNPRWTFERMEAQKTNKGAESGGRAEEADDEAEVEEEVEVPEDLTEVPDTAAVILNEGETDPMDAHNDRDEDDSSDEDDNDDGDDDDDDDEDGEDEDEMLAEFNLLGQARRGSGSDDEILFNKRRRTPARHVSKAR
ncbi:RNA polymerase III transcription factor IIIC subunit-domain-containing protein [Massariosphaeria phaeospora]|uniref:RNA polymerase III transcription factor IIIC subunit-domain-containing protein n=1 Tax=Massariosphaeria phaeospora TaxID=100035 RepID=A0A7C8M289_9PLEO|nr:RNA polymerase III transcription factor IIIC subunit-domain-containing protein [Massariosphaeria phaeospora]